MKPAEPSNRETITRAALQERAAELHTPEADQDASGDGESPGKPGAVPRDPAKDAAAFAAVVEVAANGAARLAAKLFPVAALFVGETVLPKVQGFAEFAGGKLGPAVGLAAPGALSVAGGVCSMLVWWLRTLPPPKLPDLDAAPKAEPAPPAPGAFT